MAWGDLVGTRATRDGAGGDITSHTFTLGQTASKGNLLVSMVNWDKTPEAGAGTPTCEDSAGVDSWTVTFIENSDSSAASAMAWKIADGDETTCYWSWTTSEQMIGEVGEYEGPWLSSPVDKTVTYENATVRDNIPFPPPGTLSQADEMFFAIGGWDTVSSDVTYSWDNSFTEIDEFFASDNPPNGLNGASTAKRIVSSTADIGVTIVTNSPSDQDGVAGVLKSFKKNTAAPTITDIDTDEEIYDGQLNVVITGTDFGGTTGKVYISETAYLGAAGTYVELAVDSWASTSIQVDIQEITTGNAVVDDVDAFTQLYMIVEHNDTTRGEGFSFVLTTEPEGAENANLPLETDTTYIILVRLEVTGGTGTTSYRWAYNHNSGGDTPITTTSSNVRAFATAAFVNDADAVEVLTGSGTFLSDNNGLSEDGTITTAAISGGQSTIFGLAFQLRSADVSGGQTGTIRLEEGDGTDFDTYTQTFTYTVSSSGHTSTGTIAFGGITMNATAQQPHTATAAMSLDKMTINATGEQPHTATAVMTLDKLSMLATGEQPHTSTGVITFNKLSLLASASVAQFVATGVITFDKLQMLASAVQEIPSTAAIAFDKLQLLGTAEQPHTATGAMAFDKLVLLASGEMPAEGTGAIVFDKLIVTASGVQSIPGTATIVFDPLQLVATGEQPHTGDGVIVYAPLSMNGIGNHGDNPVGTGQLLFNGLVLLGNGEQWWYTYAEWTAPMTRHFTLPLTFRNFAGSTERWWGQV